MPPNPSPAAGKSSDVLTRVAWPLVHNEDSNVTKITNHLRPARKWGSTLPAAAPVLEGNEDSWGEQVPLKAEPPCPSLSHPALQQGEAQAQRP